MLLTSTQINRICGDWDAALAFAGLPARKPFPGQPGISVIAAMHRFIESNQRCPTMADLDEWGSAEHLAIAVRDRPINQYRAELRAYRASLGLSTPADPSGEPRVPPVRSGQPAEVERKRFSWESAERCVRALVRFLFELPPDNPRVTQAFYTEAVVGHSDLPPWASLGRWEKRDGTTVDQMFREAERRLAEIRASGLEPPADPGPASPTVRRRARASRRSNDGRIRQRGQPRGVSRVVAIGMFVHEQDAFPSDGMLRWWAREGHGMSLASAAHPHAVAIEIVAEQLRSDGRLPPLRILTRREADQLGPIPQTDPPAPKPKRGWTLEECADAVSIVAGLLAPREHLGCESWDRITDGRRRARAPVGRKRSAAALADGRSGNHVRPFSAGSDAVARYAREAARNWIRQTNGGVRCAHESLDSYGPREIKETMQVALRSLCPWW